MNNKKIISEIKKINRRKGKAIENLGRALACLILFAIVAWVGLFLIGTAFYNADNLFYLKVDDFNTGLMKNILVMILIVCAVTFGKIFVYEAQKDSLKKVIVKRKKKVVR